ncbi:uncharacterized protein C1orf198 homolog [Euwallacea fornicatus]|uniref:uncharacterized protein C1orf198 homolog n=1 Tax=Euwallacea fornicatus TaxID=995702 RepID=UPI0033905754
MALKHAAEEYFSTLNPIAVRLYADLEETKGAYEDLWNKLSIEEKDQILTESVIKPEITVRYNRQDAKGTSEYAMKVVVDEHCSYRDEHSGPFSFRTKSQRNLTVFQRDQRKVKPSEDSAKALPKKTNVPLYSQEIDLGDISCTRKNEDDLSSNCSTLPKTGLDFLDNW